MFISITPYMRWKVKTNLINGPKLEKRFLEILLDMHASGKMDHCVRPSALHLRCCYWVLSARLSNEKRTYNSSDLSHAAIRQQTYWVSYWEAAESYCDNNTTFWRKKLSHVTLRSREPRVNKLRRRIVYKTSSSSLSNSNHYQN